MRVVFSALQALLYAAHFLLKPALTQFKGHMTLLSYRQTHESSRVVITEVCNKTHKVAELNPLLITSLQLQNAES